MDKNRSFPSIKGTLYHFYHYLNDNCTWGSLKLTIFAPEFRSLSIVSCRSSCIFIGLGFMF